MNAISEIMEFIPFIVGMAFLFLVIVVSVASNKKTESKYVSIEFLCTKTEANLFRQLVRKIPDTHYVAPKVRVADICLPRNRKDIAAFNRIAQKHLDFVIVDRETCKIVCAIELDDRSHQSHKAKQRDLVKNEALRSADINLYRINPKRNYDEFIENLINNISLQENKTINESLKPVLEKPTHQKKTTSYEILSKCPNCQFDLELIEMKFPNKGKRFERCKGCGFRTEPV